MKDEELAQFVPKYGDRVSVVAYSKRQSASSVQESAHGKESTSMSLMDRLKGTRWLRVALYWAFLGYDKRLM